MERVLATPTISARLPARNPMVYSLKRLRVCMRSRGNVIVFKYGPDSSPIPHRVPSAPGSVELCRNPTVRDQFLHE